MARKSLGLLLVVDGHGDEARAVYTALPSLTAAQTCELGRIDASEQNPDAAGELWSCVASGVELYQPELELLGPAAP